MKIQDYFKPKIFLIEVPEGTKRLEESDGAAIATLSSHPGFTALVNRMALQRHSLETTLKAGRHKSLEDVQFLQAGILWLDFLRSTVERITKKKPTPKEILPTEEAEFSRMLSFIERVGPQDQE